MSNSWRSSEPTRATKEPCLVVLITHSSNTGNKFMWHETLHLDGALLHFPRRWCSTSSLWACFRCSHCSGCCGQSGIRRNLSGVVFAFHHNSCMCILMNILQASMIHCVCVVVVHCKHQIYSIEVIFNSSIPAIRKNDRENTVTWNLMWLNQLYVFPHVFVLLNMFTKLCFIWIEPMHLKPMFLHHSAKRHPP